MAGLFDNLLEDADLGDFGDLFGGMGKFGTGLFGILQGRDYLSEMKKNNAHNREMSIKNYDANVNQYNNNLGRQQSVSRSMGHTAPDPRQKLAAYSG